MHFNWDDFDGILARTARVFAPPLLNFLIVLLLFQNALWTLAEEFVGRVAATEVAQGWRDAVLDAFADSDLARALAERITAADTIETGTLAGYLGATVDILATVGSVSFSLALVMIAGLVAFVFLIDALVRLMAFVIPLRIGIVESNLVRHPSLAPLFETAVARAAPVDGQDPADIEGISRYYLWLSIRNALDERPEARIYHKTRDSLLTAIAGWRRASTYLFAYILLWAVSLSISDQVFASGYILFGLILAASIILTFMFRLSRDVVKNDLETYLCLPQAPPVCPRADTDPQSRERGVDPLAVLDRLRIAIRTGKAPWPPARDPASPYRSGWLKLHPF